MAIELKFDARQKFQLDAINAVVDVFAGQPYTEDVRIHETQDDGLISFETLMAVKNNFILQSEQISENVEKVQSRNAIDQDDTEVSSMNFTIEMETGTGKTYVYLRTIHELRAKYGFKKFVIVVPTKAIKEGVLKSLQVMDKHFQEIFDNQECDYYLWDSSKKGTARQFSTADTLQIMVITIDSFNKDSNIMNKTGDYGTPIEAIKACNPIIIVDEPQLMESDKAKLAIESLNPLTTFRYTATPKETYTMLYKLDPVDAYDLGLVKKIEVDSVMSEDAFNHAYIKLMNFKKAKNSVRAVVEIDAGNERGLQRKQIVLDPGDDLQDLTRREVYTSYILDEIDVEGNSIRFTNGKKYVKGQNDIGMREQIVRVQIRATIINHLDKELKMVRNCVNAKVLSLFFIDKVSNYRQYVEKDNLSTQTLGDFALWFEDEFKKVLDSKRDYTQLYRGQDIPRLHDGYFAVDKRVL